MRTIMKPRWNPRGSLRTLINDVNASWMALRSEEHTSELQSRPHLVCRLLLEKKNEDRQGHCPTQRADPGQQGPCPSAGNHAGGAGPRHALDATAACVCRFVEWA